MTTFTDENSAMAPIKAFATPVLDTPFTNVARIIRCDTAGNVNIRVGGEMHTVYILAGQDYPYRCDMVATSGTTALGLKVGF